MLKRKDEEHWVTYRECCWEKATWRAVVLFEGKAILEWAANFGFFEDHYESYLIWDQTGKFVQGKNVFRVLMVALSQPENEFLTECPNVRLASPSVLTGLESPRELQNETV